MSFTPGPWGVGSTDYGDLHVWPVAIKDENPKIIAALPLDAYDELEDWDEDGGGSDTMEANACAIAAVPELVALLEDYDEAVSEMKLDDWLARRDTLLRRIEGSEERG